jgi:hypothetical protein
VEEEMSIEAIKQALDALENHTAIKHPQQMHYRDEAINALRAAISQADEPVLWYHSVSSRVRFDGAGLGRGWVPLYTAPRQWVGLTEADIRSIDTSEFWDDHTPMDFARVIETKLKELNT